MVHLLILLAGFAWADEPMHARVVELLSGLESSPSAADWARLGPAAAPEVLAVARDPSALPTQRGNALVALGHFPSDEARTLLSTTLADTKASSLLRRKAAYGLATGFGPAAVPALDAALADTDEQLRGAAARALATIDHPSAQAALRARLQVERAASVQKVLAEGVKP